MRREHSHAFAAGWTLAAGVPVRLANILASACLSALGELIGIRLVPSVPTALQDGAGQIVQDLGV